MKIRRFRPHLLKSASVTATDVDATGRGRGRRVNADAPWTWTPCKRGRPVDLDARGRGRPADADTSAARLGRGRFGNTAAKDHNRIDTALQYMGGPLGAIAIGSAMARDFCRPRALKPPRSITNVAETPSP